MPNTELKKFFESIDDILGVKIIDIELSKSKNLKVYFHINDLFTCNMQEFDSEIDNIMKKYNVKLVSSGDINSYVFKDI